MILRSLSFAAALALFGGTASAQSASPVGYAVAPVMEGGALAGLAVEIRFAGDADGETLLRLPGQWAGTDSLWKQVDELRVEGAASVRDDGGGTRVLTHAAGAPLVVRYRVRSGYTANPAFAYHKALPIILPGWFFFHGEGVFAMPDGRAEAPATFAWRGFPAGWTIASDLDHLEGARPGTANDVVESAAIGGPDLVVLRRQVGGATLRVAIRGEWDFTPEAFADAVAAVMEAEHALWGDPGSPFVVTMAPLGGEGASYSYTGTGRGDAFSVASTPRFSLAEATRFLAHEYMHTWLAAQVGGGTANGEARGFWFSEGWTDFYAGRALLRAGRWTPADFAADLNRVLLRHANSPVRQAPNSVIPERFWTDPHVNQLPYDRGHLLALLLDYQIRRHTRGRADMDDVMLAQRTLARGDAQAGRSVDAGTLFPLAVRQAVGMDVAAELARHVERGEPVLLPADLFGACARVETVTQPDFHRGFDIEATEAAGLVITGLDPTSPAYAAGLREGMRIVGRDGGVIGDAGVELVYRVDDAGTERVIRYLPQGKGRVTLQRVHLTLETASMDCGQVMSGARGSE
jgi:predicted metalloprotease with PDZ domain